MFKHRLRGLSKSFGSQMDPGKSEELRRTKTDIEANLTRVVKLIKNEEQSRKDGNSEKEKEIVGLIEDFYNQYQSPYALYGPLTGEHVKTTPCKMERLSSMTSSSSESEYFSSEEIDANTDIITNDSNQKLLFRELEPSSTLANNNKNLEVVLDIPLSNQLEEHKRYLELKVESQARKTLAKNAPLHNRVLELEMLLKASKGTMSVLQPKLKTKEDQAASKVSELMAPINKLEQEAKSLQNQKGNMEEKLRHRKNEALGLKKDFSDQINVMQQKLDSVSNRNKELEAQLGRAREEVSRCLFRLENLDEMTSVEKKSVLKEECFLAKIKNLELEVESRCSKQRDLEDRNNELERTMAQKVEEISELLREYESYKEIASTHAEALEAQVEKLRLELDQKSMLELQNEGIKQIGAENKQAEILWNMEDNNRLLHQTIHVGEQLNNENKESCKITKESYEEEKRRIGSNEDELRVRKEQELLLLREKVWKLEANVSKEGGEKLNLVKTVSQLERKVRKLEKNLKEKDEELIRLGEKKREAIRQLCFQIEFHRDRCLYLKDLMSKTRVCDIK